MSTVTLFKKSENYQSGPNSELSHKIRGMLRNDPDIQEARLRGLSNALDERVSSYVLDVFGTANEADASSIQQAITFLAEDLSEVMLQYVHPCDQFVYYIPSTISKVQKVLEDYYILGKRGSEKPVEELKVEAGIEALEKLEIPSAIFSTKEEIKTVDTDKEREVYSSEKFEKATPIDFSGVSLTKEKIVLPPPAELTRAYC